ncbi:MAG: response regulator transcription factor [Sedimentisphaerales bacterium]|nr:response regulator transcription factor [Sedimentisphaerales bacterium]
MKTVLIIEDNPTMVRALEDNFTIKGYRVKTAMDGEQGLDAALAGEANLIILDIMLPKINGFEICSQVRSKNIDTPIIMLTAKDQEQDIITGLNLGADDYVTKPFSIKQLLARSEALLRRTARSEPDTYKFGEFVLDIAKQTITRNGVNVALSPKEFKVLHLLVKKQGSVLTRDEILSSAFGSAHFVSAKNIDGFIKAIREKIEPDLKKPAFIHTIGDIGYKFEPV